MFPTCRFSLALTIHTTWRLTWPWDFCTTLCGLSIPYQFQYHSCDDSPPSLNPIDQSSWARQVFLCSSRLGQRPWSSLISPLGEGLSMLMPFGIYPPYPSLSSGMTSWSRILLTSAGANRRREGVLVCTLSLYCTHFNTLIIPISQKQNYLEFGL